MSIFLLGRRTSSAFPIPKIPEIRPAVFSRGCRDVCTVPFFVGQSPGRHPARRPVRLSAGPRGSLRRSTVERKQISGCPGSARQIRRGLGYGPNAGDRVLSWSGQAIREAPEERYGTLAEAVSRPAIRRREERGTAVARNNVVRVRLGLCANALGQRLAATKFGLAGQGARYGRCLSGARGRVAGDDWNGRRERQR